jgi:hypothetical protein
MKKNIKYIIILFIIISSSILFFIFKGKDLINKKKASNPIIALENNIMFEYENNKWQKLDYSDIEDYNWKKFHIYSNKEYLGKYYLVNNEEWYLFDNNKKAVNYDGELLGLDTSHKYKVMTMDENEVEDTLTDPYIQAVLSENNLPANSVMTSSFYLDIDIDSDNIEEKIYIISNKFPIDELDEESFGIVFMVKNDKIYTIYKKIDNEDLFDGCKPYLDYAIDIDQDNKYELIVGCSYYSNNGSIEYIYKWRKNAFKLLVSSE